VAGSRYGHVVDAISSGVNIRPLERCLCADHVAVLRPNLSDADRSAALTEALCHIGKAYDFDFDFNVTTRLVCTELVYRSYHRRGPIEFALIKRLGRFTLSCDDIVDQLLASLSTFPDAGRHPFRLVRLVLQSVDGTAHLIPPVETVATLRALQAGFRPGAGPGFPV
jgi:hypothetical protein